MSMGLDESDLRRAQESEAFSEIFE